MRIVHWVARELRLEKVTAPAIAETDSARGPTMRFAEDATQTVAGLGCENELGMVISQARGEAARALASAPTKNSCK